MAINARRLLGHRGTATVKRLLGRIQLDEVELAHDAFRRRGRAGVMFDVGAHYGHELAMFVEDGWRIVAFEPDDENRRILERTYGDIDEVTIDRRAVADRAATGLPFFRSGVSTGISGLHAFHGTHEQRQVVDTVTIKEVMGTYNVDHIDLLKTDIEGYDLFAIMGVDWDRDHPDVIVCEYEDAKTRSLGYGVADMIAYLTARGYVVTVSEWHPVVRYGARHAWKRFADADAALDPLGWGNLIAYRTGVGLDGLDPVSLAETARTLYRGAI